MNNLLKIRLLLPALCVLLGQVTAAHAGATADAEIFHSPGPRAKERVMLRLPGAKTGYAVDLPALPDAYWVQRRSKASPIGPREVGVGRELPAEVSRVIDGGALSWSPTADGGQVAVATIRSAGATALRAGITVYRLPDTAEVRFFSPATPNLRTVLVTGAEIGESLARDAAHRDADSEAPLLYWTPVVLGEVLGAEIYLPPGVPVEGLRVGVLRVSHLYENMVSGVSCPLGIGMGCSDACNLDATCHESGWPNVMPGVALMTFTNEAGFSSVCTGTLMNDQDPNTQIPYFLTAEHCIAAQSVASTLTTYWFLHSNGCNGGPGKDFKVLNGGAYLLSSVPEVDMTLLRLNGSPPDGTVMVGWDANPVALRSQVAGIHHPSGDTKKISFGYVENVQWCERPEMSLPSFPEGTFWCELEPNGGYLRVLYTQGTTEGGSSGSGVFLQDSKRLVGTLTGGNASCSNAAGTHFYGRFDIGYERGLSTWLAATDACTAKPGDWAYCSNPTCGPCDQGEGDCDSDDECRDGLVCVSDAGESYGWSAITDVCELPSAPPVGTACNLNPGDWGYCSDPNCGPCDADEGDCDSNGECRGTLVCLNDTGATLGLPPTLDLCGTPSAAQCRLEVGDWAYCSDPNCGTCGVGQGDCDSDEDCNSGLVCGFNAGAQFGLPYNLDVCVVPAEPVCTKQRGDWGYCADPACGPCGVGAGDCDSDGECASGLFCALNTGEKYGLPQALDVCEQR
jgi:hypothetical protein